MGSATNVTSSYSVPGSPTSEASYDVAVHKAAIPLNKGESINEFTQALQDAARTFVMGRLRMDAKTDYCYAVEVYSATAIVSYSIYSDKSKPKYGYVSVSYTRDDKGAFTFDDMTDVERVTTYRAKSQISITKSNAQKVEAEIFDKGQGAHGWQPQQKSKSLFAGVI